MHAISPDMRKAALIRQDAGRPHVLTAVEDERNVPMMTYPAFSATFSPDMAARTAQAWYEEAASLAATAVAVSDMAASLAEAADKLVNATGAPLPQDTPSAFPSNVFSLAAARARRQAVQR